MAHSEQTKNEARRLFIEGLSLPAVATSLSLSVETMRSWKRAAKREGDDWDTARAAMQISGKSIDEINAQLINMIARQTITTISEVEGSSDISPIDKVDLLTKLSDAYSKFSKSFAKVNPQMANLSVAMDIVKLMAQTLRTRAPHLMVEFEKHLDAIGADITKKYG